MSISLVYKNIQAYLYVAVVRRLNTVHVSDSVQFPDAESGEWFGYLSQEGKVAMDIKGGPFKGKYTVEMKNGRNAKVTGIKNLSNELNEIISGTGAKQYGKNYISQFFSWRNHDLHFITIL